MKKPQPDRADALRSFPDNRASTDSQGGAK
jgi:hypothetical protein